MGCLLKRALENSVNQEYGLVLGELEAVPSTVIGFPCKLGDRERSVKGDMGGIRWAIPEFTNLSFA